MFILPLFMLLSFGLLVLLVGLFVLAYSKKEGLGKIYKIVSYLTVLCGTIVFVGGIVAAIVISSCCSSGCEDGKRSCRTEIRSHHGHGSCDSHSSIKECKKSCDEGKEKTVTVEIIEEIVKD